MTKAQQNRAVEKRTQQRLAARKEAAKKSAETRRRKREEQEEAPTATQTAQRGEGQSTGRRSADQAP
jgi:hypothetical protein